MNATTLTKKIGNEARSITVEIASMEPGYLSLYANTEADALFITFCYNGQRTAIEVANDGRYLVIVKD